MLGVWVSIHEKGSMRQMRLFPLPSLQELRMQSDGEGKKRGPMLRGSLLRIKLLEVLGERNYNTCQSCRRVHGKSAYNIKFCRDVPYGVWHDDSGFKTRNRMLYVNCHAHSPNIDYVYAALKILERKGFVESRVEWRRDPIRPQAKDRMRIWALRGRLPRLDKWLKHK